MKAQHGNTIASLVGLVACLASIDRSAAAQGETSLSVGLYADQGGVLIGPGDVAAYAVGETATLVMIAEFEGAYFYGVYADLIARGTTDGAIASSLDEAFGTITNRPDVAYNGPDVLNVVLGQATLLGPVDSSNPLVVTTFEVVFDGGPVLFEYDAVQNGIVTQGTFGVAPDDFIFAMPEYYGAEVFSSVRLFAGNGSPPCNEADLAAPYGVLDVGDLADYVEAFMAASPTADLADAPGVLDLADVVAFVEAFLGGCP